MRIEIYNISYFSFSFKLNENKKVQLKKFGLEIGGLQENFYWRGGFEIFQKKVGAWWEKGGKYGGDFCSSKELWSL